MAKIKVLHVVNSLDPGGMENGVVNMIAALSPEFDFQVACIQRRGRFAERLARPQDAWVLGKKKGFSLQAAFRLAWKIMILRPDLVHTHNLGPLIYASLATIGGVIKPILHGEHSQLSIEDCSPRRLRQRALLYYCCRQVHTVSLSQREELHAKGFSPITSIVNGVDVDRFSPSSKEAAKAAAGLPPNSMVVGMVGRFGPYKRHALLLEAFGRMMRTHPDLHLLLVGAGGPHEAEVRQQAQQLQGGSRVHFAGFQDQPSRFYQAMDFLIVPSVNEGLSNAVLEAMACGIPVLANQACGNSEVITSGSQGIVMNLGTEQAIREGIGAMLANQAALATWGNSAREKCVREFSLDRMAHGYAQLYRSSLVPANKSMRQRRTSSKVHS